MSERVPLTVLLVGSGGREHALAWRLSQSPLVKHIYVAPGNGGSDFGEKCTNASVASDDFANLVKFAVEKEVNLVVPGPEQPLVDGIEAVFRKVGIPVFGPSAQAAKMEGSKAFSKDFMAKHSIPTAKYQVFSKSQYPEACNYVRGCGHRVVLKASGLAAGKGVLLPLGIDEALDGLQQILVDNVFGSAGNEVVIEEYLEGPELSVLAFSDGYTVSPLPAAQDHKRVGEGDTGPNTGGMGAYAPAPIATAAVMQRIVKESLQPTINGMRRDGYPFVGLLFTGFILTESGPKILEYNVRFGDPETEALMLLLDEKTDLAAIMLACVEHRLDAIDIGIRQGSAVSVVLASKGYPGSYDKRKIITFDEEVSDVVVFHAGTSRTDGDVVTSGGRVIAVAAFASTLREALRLAYARIDSIDFEGKTYRKDIAYRALAAEKSSSTTGLTYAQAGVSVEAGNSLVETIKPLVRSTRRPGSDGVIGGFGGVFDLKAAGYRDPVLVSGTDGVGTKLRLAFEAGIHDTVGIDLVAMSVNDLVVQGAEPLYFLDYYGCSKLDVSVASAVVRGIADGCRQAGCALIGGETAEMPGMYSNGDYDLAGFAVGAVERDEILPRGDIAPGDILLGIPSSGLHSNGFSLVRKILETASLTYTSPCPWAPTLPLNHALLTPTKIYIKSLLPVVRQGRIKALAHITGGGFIENVPRILPTGLGATIDGAAWTMPGVFRWLMCTGGVDALEMCRTFNCGFGMVLVVAPGDVDAVVRGLAEHGESGVLRIGEITQGKGVEMRGLESWST